MQNSKVSMLPTMIIIIVLVIIFVVINNDNLFQRFIPENPVFVSSVHRSAHEPYISLDKNDTPHIIWNEGNPSEVEYVKLKNNKWKTASGENYKSKNANITRTSVNDSENSMMIIDSKGNPHIVWVEIRKIAYIRWDCENWVTASGEIYDSKYGSADISERNSEDPFIVLDSNDSPHVTWSSVPITNTPTNKNNDIIYTRWNGENWVTASGEVYDSRKNNANISKSTGNSFAPKLVLDSNNSPNISWNDDTTNINNDIQFLRWNGKNWTTADNKVYNSRIMNSNVSRNESNISTYSMALDNSDNPNIIWVNHDETSRDSQLVYVKWDGVNWVEIDGSVYSPDELNKTIDFSGIPFSNIYLLFDSKSYPHLIWDVGSVYYAKWNGTNWVTLTREIFNPENRKPVIHSFSRRHIRSNNFALDSNDNPHIVTEKTCTKIDSEKKFAGYVDRIMYIKWNGENWVCADGSMYKPSE